MNILKETLVLLNWVSDKTKQEEGSRVFEKLKNALLKPFDNVSDVQINFFCSIVSLLSRAEIICLRAYLKGRMDFYTIDGHCTAYEEQTVDHWHGVYGSYLEALNQVRAKR